MRTLNGASHNRGHIIAYNMQKCKRVVYCSSKANPRHIITYTKTWLKSVARLGRAIRVSSGSCDITAACDDDGATVESVILFFISPTAFRARAMLPLPVWLWSGSLLLTTLSPDVVSRALHFIVWWYRQRHAIVPHTFSLSLTYSKFLYKTVGFPLLDIP